MLIGDAGNGKTALLMYCMESFPPHEVEGDNGRLPVLYFVTPIQVSERNLYSEILRDLRIEHRPRGAAQGLFNTVLQALKDLQVRVVTADEFENVLVGSRANQ